MDFLFEKSTLTVYFSFLIISRARAREMPTGGDVRRVATQSGKYPAGDAKPVDELEESRARLGSDTSLMSSREAGPISSGAGVILRRCCGVLTERRRPLAPRR